MGKKILNGLKWFYGSFIWLFIALYAVDIITKNAVVQNMTPGQKIDLIPGFLALTYSINTKAAFGIGLTDNVANKVIYSVIAIGATIGILFYYIKNYKKTNNYIRACLMLVIVGALGNLTDRLFYSASYLKVTQPGVVDFIDFYGIWGAIFNIADCCVVIAAILFIIYFIVDEVKENKKQDAKEKEEELTISKTEEAMKKKEIEK